MLQGMEREKVIYTERSNTESNIYVYLMFVRCFPLITKNICGNGQRIYIFFFLYFVCFDSCW